MSTIDGIFTLYQLMEKTREQRRCLYIAFVDLVKAFDTVYCELLMITLGKLSCPLNKTHQDAIHRCTRQTCFRWWLHPILRIQQWVRQGCKLAPTLFGLYAVALLWLAFKKIKLTCRVKIRLHYDSDLLDPRRFKVKSKVLTEFIREAQYADDIAIFSDTPEGL